MKALKFRLYCRECRKVVDVYECDRKRNMLPETKPEFDIITVCCSACKNPIMKITEFHGKKRKGKRS